MTRNVNADTATELATKNFNIINLLEFQGIGGSNVYLTDAPVDMTSDVSGSSQTYLSTRGMLSMGDITETDTIKIESVEITLSGVDSENVKLFLDYDYIDRRVLIHRTVISDNYAIIGSPILVFDGRLDQPRLTEDWQGQTASLAVTATSHWADFEAQAGRHTKSSEQKLLYPDGWDGGSAPADTFFDMATETQKDIKWGKD